MHIFVDTNIIIGYSLELDLWNFSSERLLNKYESFYWSNTVKDEVLCKIDNLLTSYNKFFVNIEDSLIEGFITKDKFFSIVNDISFLNNENDLDKRKLASYIWDDGGWFEDANSKEIIQVLNTILDKLNEDAFPRFNICEEKGFLYLRDNDTNYFALLNTLHSFRVDDGTNRIHPPDDEIVIDAHDLAKTKNLSLIFVTTDKKLLEFSEKILSVTNLENMLFVDNAFFLN